MHQTAITQFKQIKFHGVTEYANGTGTYEYSENQISSWSTTVNDSSELLKLNRTNLVRSGKTYSGPISHDGSLETCMV